METKSFYHICANGDDARDFIISRQDFFAAFNRVGVCTAMSGITLAAFNIEETHPHFLVFGTHDRAMRFKERYEISTVRYTAATRGNADGVNLHCELYAVEDRDYLMNVGTYILSQPTKDGKRVLPFDYIWGSAPLYFRGENTIPPWLIGPDGQVHAQVPLGSLSFREREALLHTRAGIPDNWLTCNGFLLPNNYVDIRLFESIYGTHNCYRTFLSSGRNKETPIISKMAEARGVLLEDLEARKLCSEETKILFGIKDTRRLDTIQRIRLSESLRKKYKISFRQLATLTHLPESEIRKYIR